MLAHRVIPVLILANGYVVESHQFVHSNIIHSNPIELVRAFGAWEADELVMLDVSRDRTYREAFYSIVDAIGQELALPLTVGGWIRTAAEAARMFGLGADKVCVNTALYDCPDAVREMVARWGAQAIVASVDVSADWTVMVDRGREEVQRPLEDWLDFCTHDIGCGELFVNNIAHDGGSRGYDLALITEAASHGRPVIAMGGVSRWKHLAEGIESGASGVGFANLAHYSEGSVRAAKRHLKERGYHVR